MKFLMTFEWTPDSTTRAEGIRRFQVTGGLPPAGIALLGRWTRTGLSGGYGLLETDDPQKLTEFAHAWNDLMKLTVTPVVEDQALAAVFEAGGKKP